MPSECGKWIRPATSMSFPRPNPGRAGKIAETIDRDDHRLLERRDVERRGQMGQMVLDIVKCGAKAVAGKCLREEPGKLAAACDGAADAPAPGSHWEDGREHSGFSAHYARDCPN